MRFRITVKNTNDRANDLRIAADVRRSIWAHSPVEVDPDNPLHGTHRDERGRAYFEFSTDLPEEVRRVLTTNHHIDQVDISESQEIASEACQNCGNIAGAILPAVCPNCKFRDISPCPTCEHDVPRQSYIRQTGNLFVCPQCHGRVRMRFNEPMFLEDGRYNEPLVIVEAAISHAV